MQRCARPSTARGQSPPLPDPRGGFAADEAPFFGDRCELMLPACDLLEGDFASALRHSNHILASSSVTESVLLLSQTLIMSGAALVHLGDIEEAELALRSACTLSMHASRPMTCPYCYVAQLLVRQGRLADAARTIAWIDNRRLQANSDYRDWIPPHAAFSYEEARDIVDSAFTREERDRFASEGAGLGVEQVTAMAFPGNRAKAARWMQASELSSRPRRDTPAPRRSAGWHRAALCVGNLSSKPY